jgi:hypothetical protein
VVRGRDRAIADRLGSVIQEMEGRHATQEGEQDGPLLS